MMRSSGNKSGERTSTTDVKRGGASSAAGINRGGLFSSPATTNVSRGEATQESVWAQQYLPITRGGSNSNNNIRGSSSSASNIHRGGNSGGFGRGGATNAGDNNRGSSGQDGGNNIPNLTQEEMVKFQQYLDHLQRQNQNK